MRGPLNATSRHASHENTWESAGRANRGAANAMALFVDADVAAKAGPRPAAPFTASQGLPTRLGGACAMGCLFPVNKEAVGRS